MSASQALRPNRKDERPEGAASEPCFALYVEGPRDREILRAWAWRLSPDFSQTVVSCSVILGGRQPARAALHFRALRASATHARGVCILDRDGDDAWSDPPPEPGLEFCTWGRRHIESYLLVPRAILRGAGLAPRDPRLHRIVRRHLPPEDDDAALRELNAKALFGESGTLARALGRDLPTGRIARAMERGELHDDVLTLLSRVESAHREAVGGAPEPVR